MSDFRDLLAFKKGFELAMDIFKISKKFPAEEKYSLTDQIRRSSRSVCVNVSEGYRKRRCPAHFISKLTDSDMENSETQNWLLFAAACEYISEKEFKELYSKTEKVGKLINHPDKFS
ncbi:MAG: four helix bundle protein [Bacteroidota bacterium]